MKDNKRVNKSKEQILSDLKNNAEFQKRMAFVKEKFWPALCEASANIEDAKILLTGFNNVVMQSFLALMKEKSIKDLNLGSKLDAMNDKFLENQKLLDLFTEMSVYDAKDYIEGMKAEIDTFLTDEMKERPLSSLKVKWVDQVQEELLTDKK